MATLNLQSGATTDDAFEWEGGVLAGQTYDSLLWGATPYVIHKAGTTAASREWTGMRWVDSSISMGDTIDVCYIRIDCVSTSYDDMKTTIYFEDGAAPVTFTIGAGSYDITGRARVGTGVPWDATALGTAQVNSPELKTSLQLVATNYAPTAFAAIWIPATDVIRTAYMTAALSANAPILHIEYSAGAPPAARRIFITAGV